MEIKRAFDFTEEKQGLIELKNILNESFCCMGINCKEDNCPFESNNGCLIGRLRMNIDRITIVIEDYENNI